MRTILAVVALLTLVSGQAADGADSPDGAVRDLLGAVEEQRLGDLDGIVCGEQQSAVRESLDITAELAGAAGGQAIDGLVTLTVADFVIDEVLLGLDDAEVHVRGRISAQIDQDFLRGVAESSLSLLGDAIDASAIDALLADLTRQLEEGTPFDDVVTVVQEADGWVVCDVLAVGEAAASTSAEGLCALMTVEELNAVDEANGGQGFDAYARSSWDADTALCTYDKGPDGIGSVEVGRFQADFGEIPAILPGGAEAAVGGARAYLVNNDLFVELDEGHLYVNAPAKGTGDGEIDFLVMPAGVAELILPRIEAEG